MLLDEFFSFEPTPGQRQLFKIFDHFAVTKVARSTILLKGYAGTGKTSSIAAIVKYFKSKGTPPLLMAPTGRAAKVMERFSFQMAFTIHSYIYKYSANPETGKLVGELKKNRLKNTCFIIDEVSMIGTTRGATGQGLLQDLIKFIFESEGNQLILVGDAAQLPPIGQSISNALRPEFLREQFDLKLAIIELQDVMRQANESGILFNATTLRHAIQKGGTDIRVKTKGFKDIYKITSERLEDGLRYAYDQYGVAETILICRANWMAVRYNQYIRKTIHFFENELEAGDLLMIVKNNYSFDLDSAQGNFLANGDFVEVRKMRSEEEMHGFRFATLELQLIDNPNAQAFEAKILLDTLHSSSTSLEPELLQKLRESVAIDYQEEEDIVLRERLIRKDPYLNALQVKYAYALTAHKSQGGQWNTVFLDPGPLREGEPDSSYMRWLYTSFTRASNNLFLINFDETFTVKRKD